MASCRTGRYFFHFYSVDTYSLLKPLAVGLLTAVGSVCDLCFKGLTPGLFISDERIIFIVVCLCLLGFLLLFAFLYQGFCCLL